MALILDKYQNSLKNDIIIPQMIMEIYPCQLIYVEKFCLSNTVVGSMC